MAAEDDGVGPHVPHQVRHRVRRHHEGEERAGEGREEEVVLEELLSCLAHDAPDEGPHVVPRPLAALHRVDVDVVDRDAPLEEERQGDVVDGLKKIGRLPRLPVTDAHDLIADVVVLPEHVGEGVVHDVVRVLPLIRGADVVPLPGRGVDRRVVHPIPLAVDDVVPDLHVLQDLGEAEGDRARADAEDERQPGGKERQARVDRRAAEEGEGSLGGDGPPDVLAILLSQRGPDVGVDLVDLFSEGLEGLGRELSHGSLLLCGVGHRSISTSPSAAETQGWKLAPGSFTRVPVRRSRTQPERRVASQEWQMPMRHP